MLPMLTTRNAKYLFYISERLRGENITSKLRELKNNESLKVEDIEKIARNKLRRLFQYAHNYSAFYRDRFNELGINELKSSEDLNSLTPITKNDLRLYNEIITSKRPIGKNWMAKTSGSTGMPLHFPKDATTRAYHYGAMYRGHSWYGLQIGDREARLWGVPVNPTERAKIRTIDYFLNRFREKEYSLTEEILDDFYQKIKRYRPKYIMGYGRMISEFADYLRCNNSTLEHLGLNMVKYTSENINDSDVARLQEVFCCPIVSEYGAAECGIISFQCPRGSHHIMSDCVHIEFIDSEIQGSDLSEILVTDLNNMSFPIIRYKLGDLGVPSNESCDCGLPFPILKKIEGRTSGIFSIGGKSKFHSIIFYYIMKSLPSSENLAQFRVVQRARNIFRYQLVSKNKDRKIEQYIIEKTLQQLGMEVKVEFEYFDNLPRESSGKLRDFIPLGKDEMQ